MENILHQADNCSGRNSDDGPPEDHFELAPVVHTGDGEQVAQQGNEPKQNRTVNDDDSGILGGANRQHWGENR